MARKLPPLLPGEPTWEEQDAAALRTFIVSPHGQLVLQRLIFARPIVTSMTSAFARQVQSDERAGYEACLSELLRLAEPK